jgi:hypothetical protein
MGFGNRRGGTEMIMAPETGRSCSRSALLLALGCASLAFWALFLGLLAFGPFGWLAALGYGLAGGIASFFGIFIALYGLFRLRMSRQSEALGAGKRQST